MASDPEDTFAHSADANRSSRSVMLTAFATEWNEQKNTAHAAGVNPAWETFINLPQLASEIDAAYRASSVTCKFLYFQFEECPSTGQVHIHMIVSFTNSVKWARLRDCPIIKSFTRVNFKPVFNLKGAMEYCSKSVTADGFPTQLAGPFTWGNVPQQGQRSDLESAIQHMSDHEWNVKSVAEEFPAVYVKFNQGLEKLAVVRGAFQPASKLEQVILIYGPPGSGKSHYVYSNWPEDEIYSGAYSKYSNFYHDGYRNQPVLHYDEFSGACMPFDTFKKLYQPGMDPRRSTLAMREGSIPLGSGTVIFTSNRLPSMWWDLVKIKANPWELFRRFTKIMIFGGEYGNQEDPTWVTELSDNVDRRAFMGFCVNAARHHWEPEFIASKIRDEYYHRRNGQQVIDAEMEDDVDITGHTQYSRESKRRKYTNLVANPLPFL